MIKGIVFDIKKYSVHDGAGIRSTVFLKGCPLKCLWCHNPESQKLSSQMIFYMDRCIQCKSCESVCPKNSIKIDESMHLSDVCDFCGICIEECPANAIETVGKEMSVREVIDEIKKDEIFYGYSKGGVTFSGGEPFVQFEFLYELLKASKSEGWHTSVDTCGYVEFLKIEKCNRYIDTYLYDLKIMDDVRHKEYTGVSNRLILENLERLSKIAKEIRIRIPLIPGINDSKSDWEMFLKFISKIENVSGVDILPYHNIMLEKYRRLNMAYLLDESLTLEKERVEEFKQFFEKNNFDVTVGG
ncbi:glycyl-radical enzyme activating protein [Deferribacter autotrophicus]|uniref:glycyl-radical enzyme activating protein n=1 Tax=Deferribacter autotrophicus TaxID=500465 RepID=UPI001CAA8500|nr:glycyl-radical enzyme activating protein [Deferribacter autotrophicus]